MASQTPRKSTSALNVAESARKVLRIGIVQNGRIVEEKLLKKGGHVTIGRGADNVFLIPSKDLPRSFKVFEEVKNSYVLNFVKGMDARLAIDGKVVTLNQALERGEHIKKSGEYYKLDLANCSRGKLVIGEVTILFHFVPQPPELPKPQLPHIMWGVYALRTYLGSTFIASVFGSVIIFAPLVIFLMNSYYDPNWKPSNDASKKLIAKAMARHTEQVDEKNKKDKKSQEELDKNAKANAGKEEKKDPGNVATKKVAVKSTSKDTGPATKENVANKIASDKGLKNIDKLNIKMSDADLKAIKNIGNNINIPKDLGLPQGGPIVTTNITNVGNTSVGSSVKETVVDGPCTGATCTTQTHTQFKAGEHTADNEYGSGGGGGGKGGRSGLPSGKLPKGGINTNINPGIKIDTGKIMIPTGMIGNIMIAPIMIGTPPVTIMTNIPAMVGMTKPIVTATASGLTPPGAPLALIKYMGGVKYRIIRCFRKAGEKGLVGTGTKTVKVCASISGGNFSITSVSGLSAGGFSGCVRHSRSAVLKKDADKKYSKSWCFTMHLIAKPS
ncbi:MAG: hypothetical protein JXR95_12755 [Deltaproteobacteria bacterium]|nr:hypothetical protein [Deltaproteobacteria bacterium]